MRFAVLIATLALATGHALALEFGQPEASDSSLLARPEVSSPKPRSSGSQTLSATELEFAKDLYAHGQSKQFLGRVLAWGGLGATILGGIGQQPALTLVGNISLFAGIPVNGSGTSDMVEAANQLNPEITLEDRGWSNYGLSWGLIGSGFGLAMLAGQNGSVSEPIAGTGLALVLTGSVLQFVSWYQFSSTADRAELSRKSSPYSLVVKPEALVRRDGGFAPGVALGIRF